MAGDQQSHVSKTGIRTIAQKKKAETQLEALSILLPGAIKDARLPYFALLGASAYLISVLLNTTHLDLLLQKKIGYSGQILEISLTDFYLTASVAFFLLHYYVIRQHDHLVSQLNLAKRLGLRRASQALRMTPSFTVDFVLQSTVNRLWHIASAILLFLSLAILPIGILLWMQSKTLPIHSELLTNVLRVLVTFDFLLLASVLFGYASARKKKLIVASLIFVAFLLTVLSAWLVLLIPDEWVERKIMGAFRAVNHNLVYEGRTSPYSRIEFGPFACVLPKNHYYGGWTSESLPVQIGALPKKQVSSDLVSFCDDSSPAPNVAILAFSVFGIKRNLKLDNEIINGGGLTESDRIALTQHTAKVPLHPDFYKALSKVQPLDLRGRDLRYAVMRGAFMPNVLLGSNVDGVQLNGARLIGSTVYNWQEENDMASINQFVPNSALSGADISGSTFYDAKFRNVALSNVTAIGSRFPHSFFAGTKIAQGDFRFANFSGSTWKSTLQSNFVNRSSLRGSNFIRADFSQSEFFDVDFESMFLGGSSFQISTNLGNSIWTGASLMPGTVFRNVSLFGVNFMSLSKVVGPISIDNSDLLLGAIPIGMDGMIKRDSQWSRAGRIFAVVGTSASKPLHHDGPYIQIRSTTSNGQIDSLMRAFSQANIHSAHKEMKAAFRQQQSAIFFCGGRYSDKNGIDRCRPHRPSYIDPTDPLVFLPRASCLLVGEVAGLSPYASGLVEESGDAFMFEILRSLMPKSSSSQYFEGVTKMMEAAASFLSYEKNCSTDVHGVALAPRNLSMAMGLLKDLQSQKVR